MEPPSLEELQQQEIIIEKQAQRIEELEAEVDKLQREIRLKSAVTPKEQRHSILRRLEACLKENDAKKNRTNTELEEALKNPVYMERIQAYHNNIKTVSPASIHRLYVTVSKPVYLTGFSLFGAKEETDAKYHIRVTGPDNVDTTVEHPLWVDEVKQVDLKKAVQMIPGCKYLLDLRVDKEFTMFCGRGGRSSYELRGFPGYKVECKNYEGSETVVDKGQFEGFHFVPFPQ